MISSLSRRAEGATSGGTMIKLVVALLVLLIVALVLAAGLLYLRYRRRARKQNDDLPPYNDEEKRMSSISTTSSHRRVMDRPQDSVYAYQEKQNTVEKSSSPPPSPLPAIHITFPEEYDDSGKRTSGKVVVVRVGDGGVGLEPVEELPTHQTDDDKRFESLDLDRIGGLVEKARNAPSYDKYEKL